MSDQTTNHNLIALNIVYQALVDLNLMINENLGSDETSHRKKTLQDVQHRITDSILSIMTAINIEKLESLGGFFEVQGHK